MYKHDILNEICDYDTQQYWHISKEKNIFLQYQGNLKSLFCGYLCTEAFNII